MRKGTAKPADTGGIVFVQVKCGGDGYSKDQKQHPDHVGVALGLGTSPSSPLRNLLTEQRAVERLERDRQEMHATHSGLAQFYPFR